MHRDFVRVRRGFTLLEILIAVGILGTAVVVVIGNINHAVSMYRVARETAAATAIAQSRMQDLLHGKEPPRSQHESGPVKEDPRFTCSIAIDEASLPGFEKNDLNGIMRVEVLVQWDSGVTREVRLVQLASSEGEPK